MVGDDTVTIWSIDESRQPIRRVRLSRFPAGARICLIMGCMTPAERASAVAFALKNCALEAMTPGEATMRAAAAYERGLKPVTHLIDVADEQTAMRLRAAADPAGKDRLAAGSLDDHATDRADAVFARTVLLAERRWNPSGDLDELTAIHKGLFEGVFEDAGKLRTSNTTREVTNDRARAANPEAFFPAGLIETGAHNIAMELADKRNLHALDRDVFVHAFASIYDELGYLHPFRGGNAMVLRIFGSRLAHDSSTRSPRILCGYCASYSRSTSQLSVMSAAAPSAIRRLQPRLMGASMGPGTANTSRPCSRAVLAVMSAPLFSGASTTTVARLNPLMMRFRTGKCHASAAVPGGYSLMSAPEAAMSR